jgi:hypothetical protein
MFTKSRLIGVSAGLALCTALVGCGGGGDAAQSGSGTLNVGITDGPIDDAAEVVVVFTGIELQHSGGQRISIDFPAPKSIDLLELQHGATADLTAGAAVPAGTYEWMRLKVLATQNSQSESYILLDNDNQYPLWIPSNAETGLKLVRSFTVAQGGVTNLLIDFDLRKSVVAPPGQAPNYILKPALRLLDQLQVGSLAVSVNLATLTSEQLGAEAAISACHAGVYLFAGATATPDDQDGVATDGADPVVFHPVAYDGVNNTVTLNVPFVAAGAYTVAATCNYDIDVADENDYVASAQSGQPGYQTMEWTTVQNVAVTAGATTNVTVPAVVVTP